MTPNFALTWIYPIAWLVRTDHKSAFYDGRQKNKVKIQITININKHINKIMARHLYLPFLNGARLYIVSGLNGS